jgi:hypothetical protein
MSSLQNLMAACPNIEVVKVGSPAKRPISAIARDIKREWSKVGKGVNYAAKPYLDAMLSIDGPNDSYGCDSAKSVVIYFLGNANSFRGDKAKASRPS